MKQQEYWRLKLQSLRSLERLFQEQYERLLQNDTAALDSIESQLSAKMKEIEALDQKYFELNSGTSLRDSSDPQIIEVRDILHRIQMIKDQSMITILQQKDSVGREVAQTGKFRKGVVGYRQGSSDQNSRFFDEEG